MGINGFTVREFRTRMRTPQKILAQRAGMTNFQLSRIEQGHVLKVSFEAYMRLLAALGIDDARVLSSDPHTAFASVPDEEDAA